MRANPARYFLYIILVGFTALTDDTLAVDCNQEAITLSTQDDVDTFQDVYGPGCDTVVTGLTIDGSSITDLTPLAGLKAVSTVGPFALSHRLLINNTSLTSLAGLESLADVRWIELNNNTSLTSLTALSNLFLIRGPFLINGNISLTNLDGLESLTALNGGALFIENNTLLSDLSGISNIATINASLVINNNDSLTDLSDLAGLQTVNANMNISYNDGLQNIAGLSGLVGFTDTLYLRFNSQLGSLGTLHNFTDLGGLVINSNNQLSNLDGLENLATIGNNTALAIYNNNALTNVNALSKLVSAEFNVELRNNPLLTECSGLQTLLDSTDDALPGPGPGVDGIPDVGGEVTVENNDVGCNSVEEIVGVTAIGADLSLDVQPNLVDLLAGESQEFDFILFNNGPEMATNVVLTANFDGEVVQQSLPTECGFNADVGKMLCVLNELGSGSGVVLSPQFLFPGGDQTLQASISADQEDPAPGDNSDSVPIFIQGEISANVSAHGSVLHGDNDLGQVLAGTEITFAAEAVNHGPNPATGVSVEVTVPGNWTLVGFDPTCGQTPQPDAVVLTCPLPDLPAPFLPTNPTREHTEIRLIANSAADLKIIASASENDPVPANNTALVPVDVREYSADLKVSLWSESSDVYYLNGTKLKVEFKTNVASAEEPVQPVVIFQISPADRVLDSSISWYHSDCTDESNATAIQWRCVSTQPSTYFLQYPRIDFEVSQAGSYHVTATIEDTESFDPEPSNNSLDSVLNLQPPPPIRVRALEVNQVVQDWLNNVQLYTAKDTLVRVFLEDDESLRTETTGRLVGLRGGIPVAGSPLLPLNSPIRPDDNGLDERSRISDSLNFLLPNNWTEAGDLELVFDLKARGRPPLCAEPDGQLDCRVNVSFTESKVPELDVIGFSYTTDEVQKLVFDCGDACISEPENEGDPPVIKPSETFKLKIGGEETDAIDIVELMKVKQNRRSNLLETALTGLPQFQAGKVVARRLRDRDVEDGQVGFRISIRQQSNWPTLSVLSNLKDATASMTESLAGGVYHAAPNGADLFEQVARLKTTMPLASINTRYAYPGHFDFKPTTYRDINPQLDLYRLLQDSLCATCRSDDMRVGGYLHEGGVEGSGGNAMNRVYSSYIGGSPGFEDFSYTRNTGPHELSHSFRKEHAVVQLNDGGDGTVGLCGAVASETALLHPHVQEIPGKSNSKLKIDHYLENPFPTIGPLDEGAYNEIWGVDTRFLTGGSKSPIVNPYKSVDMMSYCFLGNGTRKWVSDYTYAQVAWGVESGQWGTPDDVGQVGDIVYVAGTIDESDNVEIAAISGGTAPMPDQDAGELKLSFVDNSNQQLSSVSVLLQQADARAYPADESVDEPSIPAGFVAAVPYPGPGVAALVIGDPSAPLARIEASAHAPTVEINSPTSATPAPVEELTIEWTANDIDGDSLSTSVYYSANNGDTWSILGMNISESFVTIPAQRLAEASAALIKVSVTDGLLFAEAVSEPFEVPNSVPTVSIVSPSIRSDLEEVVHFHRFHSIAWDTEDGNLGDDAAVWSSDRDGVLGTGTSLDVRVMDLSPGCHQISATYTDSQGANGEARQEVCVRELVLTNGFE